MLLHKLKTVAYNTLDTDKLYIKLSDGWRISSRQLIDKNYYEINGVA